MLTTRHHKAGVPTWSAPTGWRPDRLGMQAAACDQPRSRRVRVPHFTCTEFVATPNGHRHVGHEVKQSLRSKWLVRQRLRALDRLANVRDNAAMPAAQLVTENPEAPCPVAADRTFPNDPALGAVCVGDRRHLDNEAPLRHAHLERRVVEVAGGPPLETRGHSLEDSTVQTYRMAARA